MCRKSDGASSVVATFAKARRPCIVRLSTMRADRGQQGKGTISRVVRRRIRCSAVALGLATIAVGPRDRNCLRRHAGPNQERSFWWRADV